MSEEQMRGQFEAYATAIGLSIVKTPRAVAFANGSRREAGDYIMLESLAAWWAWRVSRATLVVELPEEFGEDRMVSKAERHARSMTLSECVCAIQAAGVFVKVGK